MRAINDVLSELLRPPAPPPPSGRHRAGAGALANRLRVLCTVAEHVHLRCSDLATCYPSAKCGQQMIANSLHEFSEGSMSLTHKFGQSPSETPKQQRERLSSPAPVTSVDFDQNYEPIGPDYPPATASSYTVRGGDTLSSIAQSVWGDAAMWYLIADANGLRGTETLVEGQVLSIPNKVANIHNNASTFRPYNPGEAIGRVDPTLPDPPPPPMSSGGGCGGLGTFVMIVVAVVVAISTAGVVAQALGATVTSGAGAFKAGLAVLAGGSAAGVTVTGTAATLVAGAAIGAAAGAVASQVVGMATGNVEKFSWKAVGQSALAAGITAGVGSYFGPAPGATSATANASTLARVTDVVVRAGVSSAVTQAIQGKWSCAK